MGVSVFWYHFGYHQIFWKVTKWLSLFYKSSFHRWRRKWQPTPVFLPGKSHGPRSLMGYSPGCHKRVRHDLVTKLQKHSIYRTEKNVSWVQIGRTDMSDHGRQHTRPPGPSPIPRLYSNSCPLTWWCHPTIWSSVVPFSSHLQSFPASGSFQMTELFTSGGQSFGVSASTSILPMNIEDWFPLGLTGWISFQSKGLSGVFSNTTVQKHQFFSSHSSLSVQLSHPYMTTGKTIA